MLTSEVSTLPINVSKSTHAIMKMMALAKNKNAINIEYVVNKQYPCLLTAHKPNIAVNTIKMAIAIVNCANVVSYSNSKYNPNPPNVRPAIK